MTWVMYGWWLLGLVNGDGSEDGDHIGDSGNNDVDGQYGIDIDDGKSDGAGNW